MAPGGVRSTVDVCQISTTSNRIMLGPGGIPPPWTPRVCNTKKIIASRTLGRKPEIFVRLKSTKSEEILVRSIPFGGDFWCWMMNEPQKIPEILSANVRGSTVRIACGSDRLHISTFGPCKLKGRHATTFRGLLSQRTTRARVRHQIFSHQGKKSKHQRHHACIKSIYRENWVAMKKVGRLAVVSSNFTPKLQPTGNLLQFFSHQPGGKFSLPKFVCLFLLAFSSKSVFQNVSALFQLWLASCHGSPCWKLYQNEKYLYGSNFLVGYDWFLWDQCRKMLPYIWAICFRKTWVFFLAGGDSLLRSEGVTT